MNRDEILNMPAGKEMDALVAEWVMKLALVEFKDAPCPYCGCEMRFCGARSWCSQCNEWRYSPYKEYSDDISAAFEVLEKFSAWRMKQGPDGRWCAIWDTRRVGWERTAAIGAANGETISLAICRAALLAVMGEQSSLQSSEQSK